MIRYQDSAQPCLTAVVDNYGTVQQLWYSHHKTDSMDGMIAHFYNGLEFWEIPMYAISSGVAAEEH